MGEKTIKEHLTLCIAIILVGGLCLGWVGGRAIDYTFKDVRENTMFRVSQDSENQHIQDQIDDLEDALKMLPAMNEAIIRIDERIQQWEPSE